MAPRVWSGEAEGAVETLSSKGLLAGRQSEWRWGTRRRVLALLCGDKNTTDALAEIRLSVAVCGTRRVKETHHV